MKTSFAKALEALGAGRLNLYKLIDSVTRAVEQDPATEAPLLRQLEHTHAQGLINDEHLAALEGAIFATTSRLRQASAGREDASGEDAGGAKVAGDDAQEPPLKAPRFLRFVEAPALSSSALEAERDKFHEPDEGEPAPYDATVFEVPSQASPAGSHGADAALANGDDSGLDVDLSGTGCSWHESPVFDRTEFVALDEADPEPQMADAPAVLAAPDVSALREPGANPAKSATLTVQPPSEGEVSVSEGMIVDGRYQLVRVIGTGGMGVVWEAVDLRDPDPRTRTQALKILKDKFSRHPKARLQLFREASKQRGLAHPNIATVFTFGEDGGIAYIAMELLVGKPLDKFIAESSKRGGVKLDEALPIISNMAHALQHAHEHRLIHSDFKPANCFLLDSGRVKVLDFGIARAVKVDEAIKGEGEESIFDVSELGALTIAYASLEMLQHDDPVASDDVYALGVVTYELLTGRHPYDSGSGDGRPRQERVRADTAHKEKRKPNRVPGLNRHQTRALERAVAYSREQRTPSVADFIRELTYRPPIWKRPAVQAAVVIGSAILVGVGGYQAYDQYQREQEARILIGSGDWSAIVAGMSAVKSVDEASLLGILAEHAESLGQRLDDDIASALARDDFRAAAVLYDAARTLGLDDRDLLDDLLYRKRQLIEESFAQRLDQLISAYDASRDSPLALLGDKQGSGSLASTVHALRLLGEQAQSPETEKLALLNDNRRALLESRTDPARLAASYRSALERVLPVGEPVTSDALEQAERLVQSARALALEAGLVGGLEERLASSRAAFEARGRITEVEERLADSAGDLDTLAKIWPLSDSIAVLATERADSTTLRSLGGKVAPLIAAELAAAQKPLDVARLRELSAKAGPVMSALNLDELEGEVTAAVAAVDAQLADVVAAFGEALGAGRLAAGPRDSAPALLERIVALSDTLSAAPYRERLLAETKSAIYRAIAASDIPAAETLLEELRGLAAREEVAQVEADVREGVVKDREARTAEAVTRFEQAIAAFTGDRTGLEAIAHALQDIDSFSQGSHPLITEGVTRTEATILSLADERLAAGDLDGVRALVALPAGTGFSTTADFGLGTKAIEARMAEAEQAQERTRLLESFGDLAAKPVNEKQWLTAVETTVKRLIELGGDETNPEALSTRLVAGLGEAAGQLADAGRIDEAEALVGTTGELPVLALGARQDFLAISARIAQARASAEAARLADLVAGIELAVEAGRVADANKTWTELEAGLPSGDPRRQTVPKVIAAGYAALAEKTASDPMRALEVVNRGLALAADFAPLLELKTRLLEGAETRCIESVASAAKDGGKAVKGCRAALAVALADPAAAKSLDAALLAAAKPLLAELATGDGKGCEAFVRAMTAAGITGLAADSCPSGVDPEVMAAVDKALDSGQLSDAEKRIAALPEALRSSEDLAARIRRLGEAKAAATKSYEESKAAKEQSVLDERYAAAMKLWVDSGWKKPPDIVAEKDPSPTRDLLPGSDPCAKARGCEDGKGLPKLAVVRGGPSGQFGIGKAEVTVAEFNRFCEETSSCSPKGGDGSLPVTGITLSEVEAYLGWLTSTTGYTYRLPSASEWELAASAGGKSNGSDLGGNCEVREGGNVIRGGKLLPVSAGHSNKYGLKGVVGNAQEWVQGGAARGGSAKDRSEDCLVTLERAHGAAADPFTGFRVLREIKGG